MHSIQRAVAMGFWSVWTDPALAWFADNGLVGLGLLTFTEAFIQPIPPDLLVLPMAAASNDPSRLMLIFLVVTLSSVLGSLVAWWMGERWGKPLLDRFAKPSTVRRFDTLVTRYGTFGVFIAALSPIPYKVLGWCAGMGGMDRRQFIAAGLVGRSIRFGTEVLLVGLYGDQLLEFLQGPGFMVVSLSAALLAWPAWRWWEGLDETPEEEE